MGLGLGCVDEARIRKVGRETGKEEGEKNDASKSDGVSKALRQIAGRSASWKEVSVKLARTDELESIETPNDDDAKERREAIVQGVDPVLSCDQAADRSVGSGSRRYGGRGMSGDELNDLIASGKELGRPEKDPRREGRVRCDPRVRSTGRSFRRRRHGAGEKESEGSATRRVSEDIGASRAHPDKVVIRILEDVHRRRAWTSLPLPLPQEGVPSGRRRMNSVQRVSVRRAASRDEEIGCKGGRNRLTEGRHCLSLLLH